MNVLLSEVAVSASPNPPSHRTPANLGDTPSFLEAARWIRARGSIWRLASNQCGVPAGVNARRGTGRRSNGGRAPGRQT